MSRRCLILLMGCFFALGHPGPSLAKPPYKAALRRYYGERLPTKLHACTTCHLSDDEIVAQADTVDSNQTKPWNLYGRGLMEIGKPLSLPPHPTQAESSPSILSRLKAIALLDSDGDGVANDLEILAGNSPGDPKDTPNAERLTEAKAARVALDKQSPAEPWDPFKQVVRPTPPPVLNTSWVRNPIDAFLAAEHEARGLKPRPETPRHVLLRRVSLDLTGLPPTRDELHAFLEDSDPDAYEKVVDRLLASPRYGERWGRHWMDIWRYSDWAGWGAQVRDSHRHVWRWRDWIIESLNADKGYDQMLLEMLAADELRPGDRDAVRATGFLVRNHKMLSREKWMQDTVEHTSQAFLGLTLGCARCHDHMYDLITQREYYQIRAIFEPHQVRLDRMPGQSDTVKDGLARVFDADLAAATFLYIRGDDRDPDKEHPIAPATFAALDGPAFKVVPVSLPLSAYVPDKLSFVRDETLSASKQSIEQARTNLQTLSAAIVTAEQTLEAAVKTHALAAQPAAVQSLAAVETARQALLAAQNARQLAELDLPLAEAKNVALLATLRIEALDDAGGEKNDPLVWQKAAQEASASQRQAALLEAKRNRLAAAQAARHAARANQLATEALARNDQDAKLIEAAKKSATELTAANTRLVEAEQRWTKAEQEAQSLTTTAYVKRTLSSFPAQSSGRRLAFARWLADKQNPLTARVAVNHIWARHFHAGLVPSVANFGQNGVPPTHPALLDWLAAELMAPSVAWASARVDATQTTTRAEAHATNSTGWAMKHMHRLIVTSSAYRMESTADEGNLAIDLDNEYLWRMPSRRMEAEIIRDSLFYVAGNLDLTLGGEEIDSRQGLTVMRRSLYFRHAPEKQMEFLKLFDAAAPGECYERKESIVPQQALALANSELTVVQSRLLARKLAQESSADLATFVRTAFEQILSRPATTEEVAACLEFLAQQTQFYTENKARLVAVAAGPTDGSKPAADVSLRAQENLVHVLMNHNDFVTIR